MNFVREDLAGEHYSWTEDKRETLFTGVPSRRLFDRYNGNQVLFIINYLSSQSNRFSLEEARLMEDRIAHQLPLEAKSEISVLNWLQTAVTPNSIH